MFENIELFKEIAETPGISGYEDGISFVLSKELENIFGKKPIQDSYGNIFVEEVCQKEEPVLLIVSHMDEIGLITKKIDYNKNKVFFEKLGEILDQSLIGTIVYVITPDGLLPGIIEQENQEMFLSLKNSLDINKIELGYPIFLSNAVINHGSNRLGGKAFDNRVGCFAILEMLKQIDFDKIQGTLQIAFLAKAEIGFGGIIDLITLPNSIILVDTVESGDVPGSKSDIGLGNGVILPTIDKNSGRILCPPKNLVIMEKHAKKAGIMYQAGAVYAESCLSDTMRNLYKVCPNIFTVLLPIRYHHTPSELLDLNDLNECIKFLVAYVNK